MPAKSAKTLAHALEIGCEAVTSALACLFFSGFVGFAVCHNQYILTSMKPFI